MTRIAFYAPLKPPDAAVPSGDRRMARLLMQALRAAGYEVELAARFRSRDGAGDPERQARLAALGRRLAARLVRRWRGRPPAAWFTYHLYYKAPDWLGPAVSAAFGIPYFLAEASYAPKRAGGPWDLGHRAVADAVARAEAVFCLNPNDVACLRPLVADAARLVPLPPFLDAAPYADAAAARARHRADLAVRFGLDPAMPWLLAVGMMRFGDKLASYRLLGAALAGLAGRDWRLLVAGDGPARGEVVAALAPLGNRVAFAGALPTEALPPLYAAADLLVWPAMREAYGMALLEAQAAGLPVVAGRTDGVPAIVADGETGLLAAPGDAAALGAALCALLDDPARRAAMGEAARRRVAAGHSVAGAAAILRGRIGDLA